MLPVPPLSLANIQTQQRRRSKGEGETKGGHVQAAACEQNSGPY